MIKIIRKTAYSPWQCPNCKEWLLDPISMGSTMCHCGQHVSLGDVNEEGIRNVIAGDLGEPTGLQNMSVI